ncbi:MAG: hypothetical protein Q8T08_04615, partial [Ignavibacteria bacterium]|nr:hypothetical protein [Ignavibacteria bacterium]
FSDSQLAEKILFYMLKDCRIKNNREFFRCDLNIIKSTMGHIENLFKNNHIDDIRDRYVFLLGSKGKIVADKIIDADTHKIMYSKIVSTYKIIHNNIVSENPEQLGKLVNTEYLLLSLNNNNKYTDICKNDKVKEAIEYLSKHSNWATDDEEKRLRMKHKQVLQSHLSMKDQAFLKFEKERTKRRWLDNYLNREFTNNYSIHHSNVTIFYGDGAFASSGPYEKFGGAPTNSLLKRIQQLFRVVMIDEWCTSKYCVCGVQLKGWKRSKSNPKKVTIENPEKPSIYIRDYRFCTRCNHNVDRDYSAAVNIAATASGWHNLGRPKHLHRKLSQ